MLVLNVHTCDCVAGSVMPVRDYFRPSNGLPEPVGSLSLMYHRKHFSYQQRSTESVKKKGSRFPASSYCTFYNTSSLQKQQTHPWQLSRQISYDCSFLFLSHSVLIRKTYPWHVTLSVHSSRLHTCSSTCICHAKVDYAITIMYKHYVVKISGWIIFIGRWPNKNFSARIFPAKIS